jgi:hypothetical protein
MYMLLYIVTTGKDAKNNTNKPILAQKSHLSVLLKSFVQLAIKHPIINIEA